MDHTFYESILPAVGQKCLAVFKSGLKNPPTHSFYEDLADFVEAAETYNKLGKNVYHACSTYKDGSSRKGSNVAAVKALWIDLDVGPSKPYASQKDAVVAAEQFRTALGLPATHIVSSGNGIHIYQSFNKPISPENWARMASAMAACLDHFGVKHDTSRTQDSASILRIPGTQNYKTDPPKNVTLKRLGEDESAAAIYSKFKAYAQANGVLLDAPVTGKVRATNDLVGVQNYPPSEGPLVAKHCPVLEEVSATGGDVPYEVWWRAMGVAKFTTEPQDVGRVWTIQRAATGHGKHDYAKAIADWPAGPTTCAEFNKHSQKCQNCKHFGKITSPIQLGAPEVPVVQPVVQQAPAPTGAQPKGFVQPWEFGAQWIQDVTAKNCRVGFSNGSMTVSVEQDDGTYKHRAFCDRYWQVMQRVRNGEGIWELEIGYEMYPGQPFQTFSLESSAVSDAAKLRKEFSARELHIYGGPKAMNAAQSIIQYQQGLLYDHEEETSTYPSMGWSTEENLPSGRLTGDFVYGDELFRHRKPPLKVLLNDSVPRNIASGFPRSGTTAGWAAIVDQIYNRPGAEAYQFAILAGFAAPLVKLMPGNGEWHGIPVVMGGDSGAAKTTTAMVAMSIYTNPTMLKINGDPKNGTTLNALAAQMGAFKNIPFIIDELTNAEADHISSIMFMAANGMTRDRCGPDGKLIHNPHRWDTLSLITSNESIHELLKQLRNRTATEAAQYRSFELEFFKQDFEKVFGDVHKNDIEIKLLGEQYGEVGRSWVQFLVDNRLQVVSLLTKTAEAYSIDNYTTGMRKYRDLLVTMQVAGMLAKRKGFINWDIEALIKWAEARLRDMTKTIGEMDWDSSISDFFASMHGRVIVTKNMKLGRGRRGVTELPQEPLSQAKFPIARKAVDDKVFVFTSAYLDEWCGEKKLRKKDFLQRMVVAKFIDASCTPRLINIGSGTNISRPQAYCFEVDYDVLMGTGQGKDSPMMPDLENVIELNQQADKIAEAAPLAATP